MKELIWIEPNSERWLSLEDLPNEEWRDIKGFEGLYQISNYGRVKSLEKILFCKRYNISGRHYDTKILKNNKSKDGYYKIQLFKDGLYKTIKISRLVAQAFIPNPENKPEVNHKDGNKTNNQVSNLEWNTTSENGKHAWNMGLRTKNFGKNNKSSKPILQYTLNNVFVKEWECLNQIHKELGYDKKYIRKCCNKQAKQSHNYIWRWKNELEI